MLRPGNGRDAVGPSLHARVVLRLTPPAYRA
jgi:hypothetical protein